VNIVYKTARQQKKGRIKAGFVAACCAQRKARPFPGDPHQRWRSKAVITTGGSGVYQSYGRIIACQAAGLPSANAMREAPRQLKDIEDFNDLLSYLRQHATISQ